MKKILLNITLLVVFLAGCENDFDIQPKGSVSKSVLLTEHGMESMVIASYATLANAPGGVGGGLGDWVQGSVYSVESNKGSDPTDEAFINEWEEYRVMPNNRITGAKWKYCYYGIKVCNNTLNVIQDLKDGNINLINKRKGEVLVLRSLYYFELRQHFKNVPYIDAIIEASANDPKVPNDKEILPDIVNSLKEAIDLLPDVQDNIGRYNKWAAKSLLAKVYLFQKEYLLAATLLKDIIDNGVTSNGLKYGLTDNYGDNFDVAKENNKESILAVQHSIDATSYNSNQSLNYAWLYKDGVGGGGYGFWQPNTVLVQSFVVDSDGLPLLDGSYMDNNNIIPNTDMTGASQTNDADRTIPVDPRLDHTVMRRGIPFYDWGFPQVQWIRNISNGGNFMVKKHLPKESDPRGPRRVPKNDIQIRFAEVLLWYAEALVETGKHQEAREYVNQVRARAANTESMIMSDGNPAANYQVGLYPASYFDTKEKALEAIRFENKLETGMEGRRFFDLQRWGFEVAKAEIDWSVSQMIKFLPKYEKANKFVKYMMIFPIPEIEIINVGEKVGKPLLTQNDGY